MSPHSRALTGLAVNGQGPWQLVTVLLGSSWMAASLVGKAETCKVWGAGGSFSEREHLPRARLQAGLGQLASPAEKGKRRGRATTGGSAALASRPRGWRG